MRVIRSLPEFDAIREEWNRLANRHRSPLLWHEWLSSSAKALHREDDLHVALVEAGHHLAAAAPFVRDTTGGEHLEFLGSNALGEPCGFLYEADEALRELLEGVAAARMRLVLNRVAESDAARALLPCSVRGRGIVLSRRTAPSLAVPLQEDWDVVFRSWPSKLRQDVRRARRRAEARGDVCIEMTSPGTETVNEVLQRFVDVEGRSWKGRAGTSLSSRPALRGFFERFASSIAERAALRAGFLRIRDRTVAGCLAVEAYERTWVLKIAFDQGVSACSPGLLLTVEGMRDAAARGASYYEFLGSSEPWEERWRPEIRHYWAIAVYPFQWPALVRLGGDAWRALWHVALPRAQRSRANAQGER